MDINVQKWLKLSAFLALVFTAGYVNATSADVEKLQQQVNQGQYHAAYQYAQRLLDEHLGETTFDFLYGRASLEVGRYQEAAFAFERVLLNNPNATRARLELGRTFFLLKQYSNAKTTFAAIDLSKAPPNVVDNVKIFLDAIDAELKKKRTHFSGYASLMAGTDSNINTGPEGNAFEIGGLGLLILPDGSTEQDDSFVQFAGRLALNIPLSNFQGGFLEAKYRNRHYADSDEFDASELTLTAGYEYEKGRFALRVPVRYNAYRLDSEAYRNSASIGADVYYLASRSTRVSLFGQYSMFDYDDASERDSRAVTAGASWQYAFPSQRMVVYASAFGGIETPDDSTYEHLGYDMVGLRVGARYRLTSIVTLQATAYGQLRQYDGEYPLFGEQQEDRYTDYSLGLGYRFLPQWEANLAATYSNNESNIDVNDYERTTASLSLTYQF